MGISILTDKDDQKAVYYCNTSDVAFGPVVEGGYVLQASDIADAYLHWFQEKFGDPRYGLEGLFRARYYTWLKEDSKDEP